jgi:hypothetical protein
MFQQCGLCKDINIGVQLICDIWCRWGHRLHVCTGQNCELCGSCSQLRCRLQCILWRTCRPPTCNVVEPAYGWLSPGCQPPRPTAVQTSLSPLH